MQRERGCETGQTEGVLGPLRHQLRDEGKALAAGAVLTDRYGPIGAFRDARKPEDRIDTINGVRDDGPIRT